MIGSASHTSSEVDALDASFRKIFESEYAYVRRSLERLGVPSADVEDACQEVWLRVHDKLGEYDPARSLRPWLFAFAARIAANERKLARHHREMRTHAEFLSSVLDPERLINHAEQRKLLLDALTAIDPRKREVVILHDLDEIPTATVAEALGIPLNTAYSRLREGRNDLRQALFRPAR